MEPAVSAREPPRRPRRRPPARARRPDRARRPRPGRRGARLRPGLRADPRADPAAWEHVSGPVVPASPDALRALGALGQPAEVAAIVDRPPPGDPAHATL